MSDEELYKTEIINGVAMTARYYVPGLTLHDLIMIYNEAAKAGNGLAGNPSLWPDSLGTMALVKAVERAYKIEHMNIRDRKK